MLRFKRNNMGAAALDPLPSRSPPPPRRARFLSSYDSQLSLVAAIALAATALHHLTQFLGFCALTWATVVLLGGFVSQLNKRDFYVVTVLLLLEAFRFAAAVSFSSLALKKLVLLSSKPTELKYHDWQKRLLVAVIKIVAQSLQLLFLSPSIALPILALNAMHYDKGDSPFNTLVISLRIFYLLVLINGCVAAIAVLYSSAVTLTLALLSKRMSLQRYFDEVVWRGFDRGLLEASEFDFLEFAFKIQREEYSRNVQPIVVRKMYKDVMNYLLQHKKGIESARMFLDSDDSYMQETAANLIGLLVESDTEHKLKQHRQLLMKLAQKVDNDQIGWAATNSLHKLACKYPKEILLLQNEDKDPFVNVLIYNISADAPGRSIVYMRTLTTILEGTTSIDHEQIDSKRLESLKMELTKIIMKKGAKIRAKAMAGICLEALNSYDPKELNARIIDTPVYGDQYILKEEWEKLKKLVGIVEKPSHWQMLETRDPDAPRNRSNLPWYVVLIPSLAALIMLALIAAAIALLLHYKTKLTS